MNSQHLESEKIHDLLADFSTAMLITHVGGQLRARPMAIAKLTPDCGLWFITAAHTAKAHEIELDTHVHIVCQKDNSAYVSLSGTATLVRDTAEIQKIWKETYQVWFPAGPTDPEIVLIEVQPHEAEFWDNQGLNGVNFLFQAVKAYATGTKTDFHEGEQHGFVKL